MPNSEKAGDKEPGDDEPSAKKQEERCCSCQIFKTRLETGGDLHLPPWQSLMAYAAVGLGILIFFPFAFQLIYVIVTKRIHPHDFMDTEFVSYGSQIHIVESMFDPAGIYAGVVMAALSFALSMCWKRWQLAADGWVLGLYERFCCCDQCSRRASRQGHDAEGGEDCAQEGRDETRGSGGQPRRAAKGGAEEARKQCWKCFRLFWFLLCMCAVPALAWHSSLLWWKTAAGKFRECRTACKHAQFYHKITCRKMGMPEVGRLDEPSPLPAFMDRCFELLREVQQTTYIAAMIREKRSFLMFEAILRRVHAISILDLYGGLLGCIIIVVVVSAKMALRQKARLMAKLKFHYIRDHMVLSVFELRTYKRLFMGMCLQNEQSFDMSWVLRLFKGIEDELRKDFAEHGERRNGAKPDRMALDENENIELQLETLANDAKDEVEAATAAKGDTQERIRKRGVAEPLVRSRKHEACGRAFKKKLDEDLNDVVGDRELLCSDCVEHTRIAIFTFIFAAVDATLPCCARWWGSDEPFFADEEFRWIVKFNVIVTFLSDFSMFAFLLDTHSRHKAQLERIISFDCLWCFPEEDLLHSVTRDTSALLAPDRSQEYQGGDFTEGMDGLRLKQLKRWFHLRQYVQLDMIDERVSMEVAITIGVLMLVPRFTIFAVNLLVMDANFWTEQPVNLQLAWAMCCTLGVTIQSLTVTLNLNDLFDRHLQRLTKLLEETKLQKSLENQQMPPDKITALDDDPVVSAVKTILEVVGKANVPSTFFGITVNRKLIAGYVALTAASCVPQGVVIIRNFLDEVSSSL